MTVAVTVSAAAADVVEVAYVVTLVMRVLG